MANEATLWKWLKAQTEQRNWHTVRIETSTMLGCPDVNYCAPSGMEGWVELKYTPRWPPSGKPPFSLASQHKLTEQQEYFLMERARRQSCSGILAQIGDDRYFIPAAYAPDFNNLSKEQFEQFDILSQWLEE
jgi:hypothetical protein